MDILIDPYRYRATLKLVSFPYPVEALDTCNLSADLVDSWFGSLLPPEPLLLSADLVGAELTATTAFAFYGYLEHASLSSDLVSGELVTTTAYLGYGIPPETISLAADLASGELVVTTGYVFYGMKPENASLSADLVSGVLENA